MAVSFDSKPLQWDEEGIEPSDALKTNGYKPNDNPAAENENFFRNRTYRAIKEIMDKFAGILVPDTVNAVAFNQIGTHTVTGAGSATFGNANETTGEIAFTEGTGNKNAALNGHAQNGGNTLTENAQHGHVGGNNNTGDGECVFIHAYNAFGYDYNTVLGKKPKVPTASPLSVNTGDLFVVGNGLGTGARSNAFRITAAGEIMGTQAFTASGADFAECFEWLDGNPNNEDRRGLFVTLEGDRIRLATPEDDYILGVVSATPTIIGDACTDDWNGKYVTDAFGAKVMENDAWKLAEDFDESLDDSYTSRLDRPEWASVGLVGKLVVRCDDTVQINGYCRAGANGIATASNTGYRVMAANDGYARILLK